MFRDSALFCARNDSLMFLGTSLQIIIFVSDLSLTMLPASLISRASLTPSPDSFKIQAHAMFLDTAYNSLNTVLSNVHSAFVETVSKMCVYISCLPQPKRPGSRLVISMYFFFSFSFPQYPLLLSRSSTVSFILPSSAFLQH